MATALIDLQSYLPDISVLFIGNWTDWHISRGLGLGKYNICVCTEHVYCDISKKLILLTVMVCAELQNDLANEMRVMGERHIVIVGLKKYLNC